MDWFRAGFILPGCAILFQLADEIYDCFVFSPAHYGSFWEALFSARGFDHWRAYLGTWAGLILTALWMGCLGGAGSAS